MPTVPRWLTERDWDAAVLATCEMSSASETGFGTSTRMTANALFAVDVLTPTLTRRDRLATARATAWRVRRATGRASALR
ncbi:hypothetical protein [Roseitranquillus sediminis]|uniref:hypothetical protein n=1 Tax=Roseitranquillus sediminis TaxID=2809051 RepID=UPI001D0C8F24|nr:hypothetical protein [Roseitranquillus sediminis]MBM9594944.1 hypothetical protein [Roseitranquillus sediminis]